MAFVDIGFRNEHGYFLALIGNVVDVGDVAVFRNLDELAADDAEEPIVLLEERAAAHLVSRRERVDRGR